MENKHIEVEGDELLLESSEGHYGRDDNGSANRKQGGDGTQLHGRLPTTSTKRNAKVDNTRASRIRNAERIRRERKKSRSL